MIELAFRQNGQMTVPMPDASVKKNAMRGESLRLPLKNAVGHHANPFDSNPMKAS
jgi:hypothetical protein